MLLAVSQIGKGQSVFTSVLGLILRTLSLTGVVQMEKQLQKWET